VGERDGGSVDQNVADDPTPQSGEKSRNIDAEPIEVVAPGDVVATGREGDDPEGFSGLKEHGEPS